MTRSILSTLVDLEVHGEIFVHIPSQLNVDCRNNFGYFEDFESDRIYIGKSDEKNLKKINLIHKLHLTKLNPLSRNLVVIALFPPLSLLLTAEIQEDLSNGNGKDFQWKCIIDTDPENILTIISLTNQQLELFKEASEINNWLENKNSELQGNFKKYQSGRFFAQIIESILSAENEYTEKQANRLKTNNLINEALGTVGWESDKESLFKAIAKILKKHFGCQYIELIYAKTESSRWKIEDTYKINETSQSGEIMALNLIPERFQQIMDNQEAVLISDIKSAGSYLSNPKLLPFMSLKSGVLLPLIYECKGKGLLKLFTSESNGFKESDIDQLYKVGEVFGRAIDNIKSYASLKRMATIDGLTNVFSRRFFSDHLNREYKRARRYRSSLSLIMIDIDYFKHYNDTNGHLAGDKILAVVAKILKENVRGADLVARYGGEEFTVILPETGLTNSRIVAEKVRSAVEAAKFKNQEKQPNENLTISLGIATLTPNVNSANALLNLADIALYEAKKNGRNRIEVANELRDI